METGMERTNINLEYYKIFYYVGKLGSISLAARELCISQPAVSQAIRHMESQLSVKLFARMPKGVKLTSEGAVLYSYVSQGYEYIRLGEDKLFQMLNLESGEITVGASDMTLKYFLLPYLEKFHNLYPDIKVSVTNAPTPETLQFLKNGSIDFGIISTPVDDDKDVDITPVMEIQDVFVAGSRFAELKGGQMSCSELEDYPVICLEGNTSTRRFVDGYLAGHNVCLHPEFELATSDMIVQFSMRNMGIGCVVRNFACNEIDSGQLFEINIKEQIPVRNICIAANNKVPLSNAAGRLLKICTEDM